MFTTECRTRGLRAVQAYLHSAPSCCCIRIMRLFFLEIQRSQSIHFEPSARWAPSGPLCGEDQRGASREVPPTSGYLVHTVMRTWVLFPPPASCANAYRCERVTATSLRVCFLVRTSWAHRPRSGALLLSGGIRFTEDCGAICPTNLCGARPYCSRGSGQRTCAIVRCSRTHARDSCRRGSFGAGTNADAHTKLVGNLLGVSSYSVLALMSRLIFSR